MKQYKVKPMVLQGPKQPQNGTQNENVTTNPNFSEKRSKQQLQAKSAKPNKRMSKEEALYTIIGHGSDAQLTAIGAARRRKPITKLVGLARLLQAGYDVHCIGFSQNSLRVFTADGSAYVMPWNYLETAADPKTDLQKLITYILDNQEHLILRSW